MTEAIELYRKHRPTNLKEVVGQKAAITAIGTMAKGKGIPRVLLFTGPSGCGKTTLARILKEKLKCGDIDYQEINAAGQGARGIEAVSDILKKMGMRPAKGECRLYVIDECHQLTPQAQEAFLKGLEDVPSHVRFILCTTDPKKLKKTIITRCTEVKLSAVSEKDLSKLVDSVCKKEGIELEDGVIRSLCAASDGSPRKALVLLHQISGIKETADQLEILEGGGTAEAQAIDIVRAIVAGKGWNTVAPLIKACDEDPESMRRLVLGYSQSILLKGGRNMEKVAVIMEEFREPFYDIGKPGFTLSAYNCCR